MAGGEAKFGKQFEAETVLDSENFTAELAKKKESTTKENSSPFIDSRDAEKETKNKEAIDKSEKEPDFENIASDGFVAGDKGDIGLKEDNKTEQQARIDELQKELAQMDEELSYEQNSKWRQFEKKFIVIRDGNEEKDFQDKYNRKKAELLSLLAGGNFEKVKNTSNSEIIKEDMAKSGIESEEMQKGKEVLTQERIKAEEELNETRQRYFQVCDEMGRSFAKIHKKLSWSNTDSIKGILADHPDLNSYKSYYEKAFKIYEKAFIDENIYGLNEEIAKREEDMILKHMRVNEKLNAIIKNARSTKTSNSPVPNAPTIPFR